MGRTKLNYDWSAEVNNHLVDWFTLSLGELSSKYQGKVNELTASVSMPSNATLRKKLIPNLGSDQLALILGSMLGDGGIHKGRYKEAHCSRHEPYLRLKMATLHPFSLLMRDDKTCKVFQTLTTPEFKSLEDRFYGASKGKLIPLDLYKDNWDDLILAYWYLDDGHYDPSANYMTIANKCPDEKQLRDFIEFLEMRYGWGFKYIRDTKSGMFQVTLQKSYYRRFFEIVSRLAPPCLFYKIPHKFLPEVQLDKEQVTTLAFASISPGVYKLASDEAKEVMEAKVFEHLRKEGFPFVSLSNKGLLSGLASVRRSALNPSNKLNGNEIKVSRVNPGATLLEHFYPNIYECHRVGRKSPLTAWGDEEALAKLARNRLMYAESLSPSNIRKGIKLNWGAVYNYRLEAAVQVYRALNTNGKVLDYSSGFGSRALAAYLLGLSYKGYEPNTTTFRNSCNLMEWLEANDETPGVGALSFACAGSEDMVEEEGTYGLAFSSPPYFDLEVYGDESTQSIVKYPTLLEWLDGFWDQVIERSFKALTDGGVFAACLSPYSCAEIIERTHTKCLELGMYPQETIKLPFASVLRGKGPKNEVILVYSKSPTIRPQHSNEEPYYNKPPSMSTTVFRTVEEMAIKELEAKEELKKICIEDAKFLIKNTRDEADGLYEQGVIRNSGHTAERLFVTWNQFLSEAGKAANREYAGPVENVASYLHYCSSVGELVSFYKYGNAMGKPPLMQRLKRLFGGPLRPLRHRLTEVFSGSLTVEDFLEEVDKLVS